MTTKQWPWPALEPKLLDPGPPPQLYNKYICKAAVRPNWPTLPFCSVKPTRSIATPPGWNNNDLYLYWRVQNARMLVYLYWCESITGYPPAFCRRYPFKYSWVERGTVRVKCLAQEHITQWPRPGLEPGPLDPESNTPNIRPPRAPTWLCIQ